MLLALLVMMNVFKNEKKAVPARAHSLQDEKKL
jgi:hypothetical protein